MNKYEAVFIFAPDVMEENRNELFNRFKGIIEADGSISNIDEWGMRKLAYEINDYTEGYYAIVNFESNSSVVDEINRIAKITDQVIRHLVVRDEN